MNAIGCRNESGSNYDWAIAFRSTQADGNRVAKVFHYVVRNPELRCVTIL